MSKDFTTRISERPIKEVFQHALGIINYAFTLKGVDYYEWSDINSVPCERGFHALSFYNELQMRCTRDFLKAHCQAVTDVINDNTGIKITKLAKLNMVMEERLQLLHEPEIAAKLLSVVFFDESENPLRFDYAHAAKKAKTFLEVQQDEYMYDFFFLSAHRKVDSLFKFVSSRFSSILSDNDSDNEGAIEDHFYDAIRGKQEQRLIQLANVANARGFTLNETKDLSIYEYYLFVEDLILKQEKNGKDSN